ncbi:leucine-rich repeat domain-containing protein [Planctomicrobium piriforme]|uniref:Internalin A n=1 Tax=Planctomicrobium piriforme TaxID=1576369 RepID=A0A1I3CZT9_9PLAN|nr:leucine-rich repeat domain-containing protein [Planctomicrobium piriforme]SFH79977.1 internalin A [Planctomicrobium piriforme]
MSKSGVSWRVLICFSGWCGVCLTGCDSKPTASTSPADDAGLIPVSQESQTASPTRMIPADEMRKQLGANSEAQFERSGPAYIAASLSKSGATTLEPLRGQPLKMLDLTQTKISDLTPLEGMPLEKLAMIGCPVANLKPLAGMPLVLLDASETQVSDIAPVATLSKLRELYLEKAKVGDLSPLAGVELDKLWLNFCPVEDLTPLKGKHLTELNLCNTPIRSLDVIPTMEIGTLWLRETPVTDISPLVSQKLVSLDLQGTGVKDLSPLREMKTLERLNIAGSDVTDLTPLAGLQLSRLVFSPEKITTGLEVVRGMKSLRQLDTSFEGTAPAKTPSEFWELYDSGKFKPETTP